MLRKPTPNMQYALDRAAKAAEIADAARTPQEQAEWRAIERSWLKLANSYDASERLENFISEQNRRRNEIVAYKP